MKIQSVFIAIVMFVGTTITIFGQDQVVPVRMGSGSLQFETVPGWGLRPDGSSALGPTHGGVVVDSKNNALLAGWISQDGNVTHCVPFSEPF